MSNVIVGTGAKVYRNVGGYAEGEEVWEEVNIATGKPTMSNDERAILAKIEAAPADATAKLVYADWLDEHDRPLDAAQQRVLAEPSEDRHRLDYAAACERMGPARGKFISNARAELVRVQVELAKLPEPEELTITVIGTEDQRAHATCRACRKLPASEWCRFHSLHRRSRELLRGPRPELYEYEVIWFNSGNGTDTWRFLFQPQWRRGFVEVIECTAADWLAHGDAIRAAHPVTRVRLTTLPLIAWVETGRRKLAGRTREVDFGSETAASQGETVLPALLNFEWPGVTFELPP